MNIQKEMTLDAFEKLEDKANRANVGVLLDILISDMQRVEQKKYSEILKSAKAIYAFRDHADTVGNEAYNIIKKLEG
jgi:hypothetical protein